MQNVGLLVELGNSNLRLTDVAGVDNQLIVRRVQDLSGDYWLFSDAAQLFAAAPQTTPPSRLADDGHSLLIPYSAIGDSITFAGGAGDDRLTVDLTTGDAIPDGGLFFDGQDPTSGVGDLLEIVGGQQGVVTYNYWNASDGDIVLENFGTIVYTGLEPITNTGTATDVVFNLPASINVATLADDGIVGNGLSRLSGGTFEATDFANPTGSMTINRGNVSDSLTFGNLPDLSAAVNIGSTAARFNWVTFDGTLNLGPGKDLTGFANQGIAFSSAGSDVATSGSGAISLTVNRDISFVSGSSLTTVNGALNLTANMVGGGFGGIFTGILLNDAVVQSIGLGSLNLQGRGGNFDSGSLMGIAVNGPTARISTANGDLTLYGRGGGTATVESNYGILVAAGGVISAGGAGNLNALAEGGNTGFSGQDNIGIKLRDAGSQIITQRGNLTLDGRGGGNTSAGNDGILLEAGTRVAAGGLGTTSVTGKGGGWITGGGDLNIGVHVWGGEITSGGGPVVVAGTGGGASTGNNNYGVNVHSGGVITAGVSGSVEVTGTGGNNVGPSSGNYGVRLAPGGTITSSGGNVAVTGIAGGAASSPVSAGLIMTGGVITSGGAGTLTVQGNQGNGAGSLAQGIVLSGTASIVVGQGAASIAAMSSNTAVPALDMLGSAAISTTGAGNLLLTADRINLAESSTVNNGANTLTILPTTNGFGIDLGGADNSTTLGLTDAELDRMTAGTLRFANLAIAPITVSAAISRPALTNVILNPSSNIVFATGSINTAGGMLTISLPGNNVEPQTTGVDITAPQINFADTTWLKFAVNGATANTQYSQLNVVGGIDLSNTRFTITGTYTPTAANTFTIINNDGSDAVVGTFVGWAEGALVSVNGVNKRITYRGGTGNDVVLRQLNSVPTITSNGGGTTAIVSAASGESLVTTVTATDADVAPVDTLTYSISGGADQARFTIDPVTGQLRFISPPLWYTPVDVGANNTYDVTVRVADNYGGSDTQALAVSISNLISIPNRKDLIYDHVRRQLLVTTDTQLLRYDEATGMLLATINVGSGLVGGDITPDGNYFYVSTTNPGLRKVDLNTGVVTSVQNPAQFANRYTRDIAFLANGIGMVAGPFGPNGSLGALQLNPATDTYDLASLVTTDVYQTIYRSADRTSLLFVENGIYGGFSHYSLAEGFRAAPEIPANSSNETVLGAISRNGEMSALEGARIFDRNYQGIQEIPGASGGMIFHPLQDLMLVINDTNGRIFAYDTNTWELRYFLATKEDGGNTLPYNNGVMAISANGEFLYHSTMSGVRQYRLPMNTGVASQIDLTNYGTYLSTAHTHSITVTMRDPSGEVATGYTGTVRFASGDTAGILPANYTFTPADAGTHTFTFRLPTPGLFTNLNVQDVSNASISKSTSSLKTHNAAGLIPITGAREVVFDHVRNMAYIMTSSGTIERYDVATESLIAPWNFSKNLAGADITPDGQYLYVQEGYANAATGMVRKIDLDTGEMTRLHYDLAWQEEGGWELVIDANGIAVLASDVVGGGTIAPLRRLDTATDTFTLQTGAHALIRGPSYFYRNHSRTMVGFIEPLVSNGPIYTYNTTTNTFPAYLDTNSFYNVSFAINNAGTSMATSRINTGSAVEIRNPNTLAVTQTISGSGGLAFRPGTNLLYVASGNGVSVYDGNNSWTRSTPLSRTMADSTGTITSLGGGNMTFAADGRRLFVVTQTGVNVVLSGDFTPPTVSNLPTNQTILEDASTTALPFTISDNLSLARDLILTATSSNSSLIPVSNIVFGGTSSARTVTVTPAANQVGGPVTITVTVTDAEANSAQFSFTVLVNPVNDAPTFVRGADVVVPANSAAFLQTGWATAISPGPADESGQTVAFSVTGSTNAALFSSPPAVAADGTLTFTPAPGRFGSATLSVVARDTGGTASGGNDTSGTQTITITVEPPNSFHVSSWETTGTGVAITFSRDIDPTTLNLFDVQGSPYGPADIVLIGAATGPIRGSAIVSAGSRRLTFVSTTGVLPPDDYTILLRSAANGLRDTTGELLDGDADGVPGGNIIYSFSVNAPAASAVTVGIPNFARGPGQPVNLPGPGSGIPLTLSDGAGITSASLHLRYDPALLSIASANVPAGLPAGAAVSLDTSTPGTAIITFNSPTPLAAGATRLVELQTNIPSTAPYRAKQVLDLRNVTLNGGSIPALEDDGVQVAAYFADVTGNGTYSAQDASLLARLTVGIDGGLAEYLLLDPTIVGDITGNGSFSGTDTSLMLQAAVGIPVAEIPTPLPTVSLTQGGPDPKLSIPQNLVAAPGGSLIIPVDIDSIVNLSGNGLASADLVIYYDPTVLAISSASLGSLVANRGWMMSSHIDPLAGRIDLSLAGTRPLEGFFRGQFVQLQAIVKSNAAVGASAINLAASSRSRTTQLNEGFLTLIPAPTDAADDAIDGRVTVLANNSTPAFENTVRLIGEQLVITGSNGDDRIWVGHTSSGQLRVRIGNRLLGDFAAPAGLAVDALSGSDFVYVAPSAPPSAIAAQLNDLDQIFGDENCTVIDTAREPAGPTSPLTLHAEVLLQILSNWENESESRQLTSQRRSVRRLR